MASPTAMRSRRSAQREGGRIPLSPPAFAKPLASLAGYGWRAQRVVRAFREGWCKVCSIVVVTDPAKRFVYIIRSLKHTQTRYIGVTSNVAARLNAQNAGRNRSTALWKPRRTDVTIEFRTERMALRDTRNMCRARLRLVSRLRSCMRPCLGVSGRRGERLRAGVAFRLADLLPPNAACRRR